MEKFEIGQQVKLSSYSSTLCNRPWIVEKIMANTMDKYGKYVVIIYSEPADMRLYVYDTSISPLKIKTAYEICLQELDDGV